MRLFVLSLGIALLVVACSADGQGELLPEPDVGATVPGTEAADPGTEAAGPDTTVASLDLEDLGPAKGLARLDGWLQTDITSLEDLRGKVVVVQFWTFGCINCKNTLANLRALYDQHQGEDFEVVGVHSPEFSYEEDPVAIGEAAVDLGVTWPIALDTDKFNFFRWQGGRAYWPRTYVLDRDGHIRFDHIGEGAYDELNETVIALLG